MKQISESNDAHRHNNFDLLRLLFASIVVLYHCYDLSFSPAYLWIPYVASANLAVQGFFAMSGFLIIGSYESSSTLRSYLSKRGRRILPAYWAALIFTLILGMFFSTLHLGAFLSSGSTWKYAGANFCFANFLHPSLPGLFDKNPVMSSVNGSLWTIKLEVMFYLSVPVIVWLCRKMGKSQVLGGLFLLSVIYVSLMQQFHPTLASQLPGQLCFFMVGALAYYYQDWCKRNAWLAWTIAIICYLISIFSGWIAFRAVGVSLGVICFALLVPPIGRPAKYGDFSYGTYVYHFPVIQTFIALGLIKSHPDLALGLILLSVTALSFTSWNLIEKPFLRRHDNRKPTSRTQLV
jgi:peptidoglycan/LPS O-acetylase OafA/YrhL